jgi:isocitrate dehydrogenase
LIQDYIADVTFQHLLTRPRSFDVIATSFSVVQPPR